ncbi:ZUO1 [Sanghuangporus weigelae]
MATVINLPITAPPTPASWMQDQINTGQTVSPASPSANLFANFSSELKPVRLLPAGSAYLAHVRRSIHNHSFEEHDKHEEERRKRAKNDEGQANEDDLGVGDEEETLELLTLDPKEWKKQDHYAVLGLSHLRYKATQEQIKIAHRKKVLKHHPDKKAGLAGDSNDDAFFKCIQKAQEVLSNPEKRRQFDSIDPYYMELEEEVPKEKEARRAVERDPKEFFDTFGPIFEREARFSKNHPVPMLGAMDDSKQQVESFYDFWYNFDSWRSFEYLDKEVNEGSDNRDDKRYTEKKNRSERARRKKEDNARLRSLVDLALAVDPRMKRIKQEEKEAREAKRRKVKPGANGGEDAEKKRQEEEAEKKRAEEATAREKVEKEKEKKAKAKAAKDARRAARKAAEESGAPTPPNGAA